MNLLEHLSCVQDKRRKQGVRYRLDVVLSIYLLALMSACVSTRSVARFAKNHAEELGQLFDLPHGVPSHVTLQEILTHLDVASLQSAFNRWASTLFSIEEQNTIKQRVLACDGKALRATLKDYSKEHQDFVCFVHVFAAEAGIIVHAEEYKNGHKSEIAVLQDVLEHLSVRGAIFTMDALHTQKKRLT
jgi:DDE_Tnp_1-associated